MKQVINVIHLYTIYDKFANSGDALKALMWKLLT